MRKGGKTQYHTHINQIHPDDSLCIRSYGNSNEDYLNLFNNFEYLVCYDPLTFVSFIAALCGCISIVYPVDGLSKEEWIKTTCLKDYFNNNNINVVYGIAYGLDDLEWAKNTIHLVEKQMNDIIQYYEKEHLTKFLYDIDHYEEQENTVQNNYFRDE